MFSRWNWSYAKITADSLEEKGQHSCPDPNQSSNDTTTHPKSPWRPLQFLHTSKFWLVALILILVGVLGIGVPAAILSKSQTNSQSHSPMCGNSTEEAISRGCTFNQLMWAWFPPHCPTYASQDFVKAENWTYYQDYHGNGEIGSAQVIEAMDSGVELWTQQREHVSHCMFMFLSLGQIIRDGTVYSEKMTNYHHIEHCVKMVLEMLRKDGDWHKITTSVPRPDYNISC